MTAVDPNCATRATFATLSPWMLAISSSGWSPIVADRRAGSSSAVAPNRAGTCGSGSFGECPGLRYRHVVLGLAGTSPGRWGVGRSARDRHADPEKKATTQLAVREGPRHFRL
jgi:hypothetical protein